MTTLTAPLSLDVGDAGDVGGVTLEQRLEQVWRQLEREGVASCPVCEGRMTRVAQTSRCGVCGSTLH